jgi:hypothetical protein
MDKPVKRFDSIADAAKAERRIGHLHRHRCQTEERSRERGSFAGSGEERQTTEANGWLVAEEGGDENVAHTAGMSPNGTRKKGLAVVRISRRSDTMPVALWVISLLIHFRLKRLA